MQLKHHVATTHTICHANSLAAHVNCYCFHRTLDLNPMTC